MTQNEVNEAYQNFREIGLSEKEAKLAAQGRDEVSPELLSESKDPEINSLIQTFKDMGYTDNEATAAAYGRNNQRLIK